MWTAFNSKRTSSTQPLRLPRLLVAAVALILPIAAYLEAGGSDTDTGRAPGTPQPAVYEGHARSLQNQRPARPLSTASDLTPRPSAMPQQIAGMPAVRAELEVVRHRSRLIVARSRIKRSGVADSSIAQVVQYSPEEISVIGMSAGSTTLTLWFEDETEPLIYLVKVFEDPMLAGPPKEVDYAALEHKLSVLFPRSRVALVPLSGRIIVKGDVPSPQEAQSILQIIREETALQPVHEAPHAMPFRHTGMAQQVPQLELVNQLQVRSDDHVKLYVRVVELDRNLLRQMGLDLNSFVDRGRPSVPFGHGHGSGALAGLFERTEIDALLGQLASCGALKGFSEPTLTVLSGHSAGFLSGGEFALPMPIGSDGSTQTMPGYGASLIVVPTVIGGERVRLRLMPEFQDGGMYAASGTSTPARRLETTVELRQGQTVALTGLVRRHVSAHVRRRPFLGNIPVVGKEFNETYWSQSESELLILVSPEIISRSPQTATPPNTRPSIARPARPHQGSTQQQVSRRQAPPAQEQQAVSQSMAVGESIADEVITQVNRSLVQPPPATMRRTPIAPPHQHPQPNLLQGTRHVPQQRRIPAPRPVPQQPKPVVPPAPILFQPGTPQADQETKPASASDSKLSDIETTAEPVVEKFERDARRPEAKPSTPAAKRQATAEPQARQLQVCEPIAQSQAENSRPQSATPVEEPATSDAAVVAPDALSAPTEVAESPLSAKPAEQVAGTATSDSATRNPIPSHPVAPVAAPTRRASVHPQFSAVPHQPRRPQVKGTIPNLDRRLTRPAHITVPQRHQTRQHQPTAPVAGAVVPRGPHVGPGVQTVQPRQQASPPRQAAPPQHHAIVQPVPRQSNRRVQSMPPVKNSVPRQPAPSAGYTQLQTDATRPTAASQQQTNGQAAQTLANRTASRLPVALNQPASRHPASAAGHATQPPHGVMPRGRGIAQNQHAATHAPANASLRPAGVSRTAAVARQSQPNPNLPGLTPQHARPLSPAVSRSTPPPSAQLARQAAPRGTHAPANPRFGYHQRSDVHAGPNPAAHQPFYSQLPPAGIHRPGRRSPAAGAQAAYDFPQRPHVTTAQADAAAGTSFQSRQSIAPAPDQPLLEAKFQSTGSAESIVEFEIDAEIGPLGGPVLMAPDSLADTIGTASETESTPAGLESFVGPTLVWSEATNSHEEPVADDDVEEADSEGEDEGDLPLIVPRSPR